MNGRMGLAPFALLALAGIAKVPTLSQPLIENFAWRQTQTAWTALIYHRDGIDLLHPQVPVHGPPWTFGFEFPLFQAVGAVLMNMGMPPDLAMRTLGLVTFLVTGWLLYGLVMRLAGRAAAIVTLGAFLFSPFGLLWGRTSLIEYLATAFALAYLLAGIQWLDRRRPVDFALAVLCGTGAALVKITTGAFYLLPLLGFVRRGRPTLMSEWSVPTLVVVPALVAMVWTAYIDTIKAASPATRFLTSSALIDFNFGTPEMRFDGAVLLPIVAAIAVGLTGAGLVLWVPAAIARVRRLEQSWLVGSLLAIVLVAPPLVLTPLYSTQNYYPAAISPVAAMLVGLGAAWAWDHRRSLMGRFVLLGGSALWIASLWLTAPLWLMSYEGVVDRDGSLAAAAYVRAHSDPEDWVVIRGRNWDPTILYYADRRGYMLDARRRPADDVEALRRDGRYTLFLECPYEGECTELTTP
jgi:hypothetical protein